MWLYESFFRISIIFFSDDISRELHISSSTSIPLLKYNALANDILCNWPPEIFFPSSVINFSKSFLKLKNCSNPDSKNTFLKEKEIEIQKKLSSNKPTIPTTLGQEIKTNIFFRCNDPEIRQTLGLKDSSEAKVFSKLRDLKDSF